MGFIRKAIIGKELYNLEQKTLKTMRAPKFKELLTEIIRPILVETSAYSNPKTHVLTDDYYFNNIVDYIYGFICSAIKVNIYNKALTDLNCYELLKETCLVSIFGLGGYSNILEQDGFPKGLTEESREGELDARKRFSESNAINMFSSNFGLPSLRASLYARKLIQQANPE